MDSKKGKPQSIVAGDDLMGTISWVPSPRLQPYVFPDIKVEDIPEESLRRFAKSRGVSEELLSSILKEGIQGEISSTLGVHLMMFNDILGNFAAIMIALRHIQINPEEKASIAINADELVRQDLKKLAQELTTIVRTLEKHR